MPVRLLSAAVFVLILALAFAPAADEAAPAWAKAELLTVRGGLPNVARKLAAGAAVTVVFLGGSVTEGGGAEGYVARSQRWFDATYGAGRVTVVNAGIGGTDSDFGEQRFARDVLANRPDLVVIEFAVNDHGDH